MEFFHRWKKGDNDEKIYLKHLRDMPELCWGTYIGRSNVTKFKDFEKSLSESMRESLRRLNSLCSPKNNPHYISALYWASTTEEGKVLAENLVDFSVEEFNHTFKPIIEMLENLEQQRKLYMDLFYVLLKERFNDK